MNDKTDGGRLARRAVGVAAVAGVCLLSAACGLVHVSANSPSGSASATAGSATADSRADLAYAQCMQTHGVPNFPDPTFSGGGVHIEHEKLNESSPAFKAAVQACESLIPGGVHGGSGSSAQAAP